MFYVFNALCCPCGEIYDKCECIAQNSDGQFSLYLGDADAFDSRVDERKKREDLFIFTQNYKTYQCRLQDARGRRK